jgi:hypothetical protein
MDAIDACIETVGLLRDFSEPDSEGIERFDSNSVTFDFDSEGTEEYRCQRIREEARKSKVCEALKLLPQDALERLHGSVSSPLAKEVISETIARKTVDDALGMADGALESFYDTVAADETNESELETPSPGRDLILKSLSILTLSPSEPVSVEAPSFGRPSPAPKARRKLSFKSNKPQLLVSPKFNLENERATAGRESVRVTNVRSFLEKKVDERVAAELLPLSAQLRVANECLNGLHQRLNQMEQLVEEALTALELTKLKQLEQAELHEFVTTEASCTSDVSGYVSP